MTRAILTILLGVMLAGGTVHGVEAEPVAAASPAEPAIAREIEVGVSGLGWLRNRKLRDTLKLLESADDPLLAIDAAFVEDGVVILQSALERDGFLEPSGEVVVWKNGVEAGTFPWTAGSVPAPPRELNGDRAQFRLEPGVRYLFETIEFEGLSAIDESDARRFFIEEGFIFGGARARRFTPSVLSRGVGNLREQLAQMGYAEARVVVVSEVRDEVRGRVDVKIRVDEGKIRRIGRVVPPAAPPAGTAEELAELCADASGEAWSFLWQQDLVQSARAVLYEKGYALAEAALTRMNETPGADAVVLDFQLAVTPGAQIDVGSIGFSGEHRVRQSVLDRAIELQPGDLFVRHEVEKDRLKLGALGAFSSVRAVVDPVAPDVWNLDYALTPGKRLEASLLAGYGSYEQLRVGFEVFHSNLLGRAHRGRLQVVQSMKSSSADYLYSIPQVFGTVTDASIQLFGIAREEVSFDREEFGASLGLRRYLESIGADAALRYQYESVFADVTDDIPIGTAPTDSRVASLSFDLTRDRRDNPLTPRRGHFQAITLETAAKEIGGNVDYQRVELRGAWHRRIGGERHLHAGLRHGLLWAFGTEADGIPLAKRFFPGGENTVRGFREGRAAPRNAEGVVIGAEVSTLINVELEQYLARDLSAVLFVDAGLTGAALGSWPGDQWRVSVGLGLRYNTIIGPVRLEYGHNVVKETGDQVGELHLALGFPF